MLFVILVCPLNTAPECCDFSTCVFKCVCILAFVNGMLCVSAVGRLGNVFWESYPRPCSFVWLSPSLCSSKRAGWGVHQHVQGVQGGGQKVRDQVTICRVRVRRAQEQTGGGLLSLHHSRTQQRQNLWRLPPTEGGGVTGAKYACTLMLGRWVCSEKKGKISVNGSDKHLKSCTRQCHTSVFAIICQ